MGRRNIDQRLYDAEWMREAYTSKTVADLAQELHVAESTVRQWLMRHRIQRRKQGTFIHKSPKRKKAAVERNAKRFVGVWLTPHEYEQVRVLAIYANRNDGIDDCLTDGLRYAINIASRVVGSTVKGEVASLAETYGSQAEGALFALNLLIELADKDL